MASACEVCYLCPASINATNAASVLIVVLPGPPWHASVAVLGGWLIKTAIQTGMHAYLLT